MTTKNKKPKTNKKRWHLESGKKKHLKFLMTHNEKRGFGDFDAHMECWKQEG